MEKLKEKRSPGVTVAEKRLTFTVSEASVVANREEWFSIPRVLRCLTNGRGEKGTTGERCTYPARLINLELKVQKVN